MKKEIWLISLLILAVAFSGCVEPQKKPSIIGTWETDTDTGHWELIFDENGTALLTHRIAVTSLEYRIIDENTMELKITSMGTIFGFPIGEIGVKKIKSYKLVDMDTLIFLDATWSRKKSNGTTDYTNAPPYHGTDYDLERLFENKEKNNIELDKEQMLRFDIIYVFDKLELVFSTDRGVSTPVYPLPYISVRENYGPSPPVYPLPYFIRRQEFQEDELNQGYFTSLWLDSFEKCLAEENACESLEISLKKQGDGFTVTFSTPPKEVNLKLDEVAKEHDLEITVLSLEKTEEYDWCLDYLRDSCSALIAKGKEFYFVKVKIVNNGKKTEISPSYFHISDDEGNLFGIDPIGISKTKDESFYQHILDKNEEQTGFLSFVIPKNAKGLKISYDYWNHPHIFGHNPEVAIWELE